MKVSTTCLRPATSGAEHTRMRVSGLPTCAHRSAQQDSELLWDWTAFRFDSDQNCCLESNSIDLRKMQIMLLIRFSQLIRIWRNQKWSVFNPNFTLVCSALVDLLALALSLARAGPCSSSCICHYRVEHNLHFAWPSECDLPFQSAESQHLLNPLSG